MARIPVVDENDLVIGLKEKKDIKAGDIYRVSALWITNDKGQHLLARRAETKKLSPGKWGPAVAGTVEEGESYESNILKEAAEEIGLTGVLLVISSKTRTDVPGEGSWFAQWFTARVDKKLKDFTIEKKEVAGLKWWDTAELREKLQQSPELFVPNMKTYVKLFCK